MKKITILLTILAIVAIAAYLVFREGTLAVNARDTTSKIFTIAPGEGLNEVVKRLENEELIRNKLVFYIIIKQTGIDKKIQAGQFRLSSSMNAYKLAEELTHGTNDTWVTIIEGLRKEEIADEVSSKLGIPASEFIAVAKEGYLFPDTYLFPQVQTADDVVNVLYKTYKAKVTPDIIANAKERGLSETELITFASIIEREARSEEARRNVASILLKRMNDDHPIQADATVQYALGYDSSQKTYWRKNLTFEDLKFESPYNTYTNTGLPPGPICSPSLSSIIAASEANPNTPYFFYITGNDNKMHYARDLDEHNRNIERYLK